MSTIEFSKIFSASPVIYSILAILSVVVVAIWLHSMLSWRSSVFMPKPLLDSIKKNIKDKNFNLIIRHCNNNNSLISPIIIAALKARTGGFKDIHLAIEKNAQNASYVLWQKLTIIKDIATVAPMFGLLGTVLGLFYALYDVNRSIESINALFDGFGVAVGTTICGITISIMAIVLHATLKYRLRTSLKKVEKELLNLVPGINNANI